MVAARRPPGVLSADLPPGAGLSPYDYAIERMVALAQDERSNVTDRQRAVEILEELGPAALNALAAIANDGDSTDLMRGPALQALRSVAREARMLEGSRLG